MALVLNMVFLVLFFGSTVLISQTERKFISYTQNFEIPLPKSTINEKIRPPIRLPKKALPGSESEKLRIG